MAYTPELTQQYSGALRRIAWALQMPMTKAIESVLDSAGGVIEKDRICKACRDPNFCRQCPFPARKQQSNPILKGGASMTQVLVTTSRGIIEKARLFENPKEAVEALSRHAQAMNPEHDDAALFDAGGLIANAKHFLDENDEYQENNELIQEVSKEAEKPLFIIGNPDHRLGFMVASPDDPLGYDDPAAALSDLGQMRQDFGEHLKLYRVVEVKGPLAAKAEVEKHNHQAGVENFDYSLVEEYIRIESSAAVGPIWKRKEKRS